MTWEPVKNKPATFGWYLVALPGKHPCLPCVTLAWYDNKWNDPFNFGNDERMPLPLYWQPLPGLPPTLLATRARMLAR